MSTELISFFVVPASYETNSCSSVAVFVALESNRDAAVAMSLVLVAVSLVVLLSLRDRWWTRP